MNLKSTSILTRAANYTKGFEGWLPVAKWDYKQWTNGYGTRALTSTEKITTDEAHSRLAFFLSDLFDIINSYKVSLTDSQKIALADFGYNLGPAPMKLQLSRLKAGQSMASVAATINQYINAGGSPNDGLIKRRASNVQLLLKKKTV